ncbi:MAG: DUF3883 domain-containing protein [Anaerolineae bacterium]|nr:DUF3883 domain-containing protein [Anaerolineae bacterium]
MDLQVGQLITAPFLPALAEVKKFEPRSGAIRLSANEWKKARHFGKKFWLYVVTGAGTDAPQLHRVHNPAAHFRVGEDIVATGYIIHEETCQTNHSKPQVFHTYRDSSLF